MAYLSRYCNVISASDAIANKNISRNKKNIVITFDDGYKNNYINAFPILLKYNLPALFSISTDFVVNKAPLWFDIIEFATANTNRKSTLINLDGTNLNFPLETTINKIKFLRWLHSKCIEIAQEQREQFIRDVVSGLDVPISPEKIFDDPDYAPLSAQEIKIISESKIAEFAAHSVHHYLLSRVSLSTLKKELTDSKSDVEHLTGLPCKFFCIPGGFYDNSVINAILDAKFEKIFSSNPVEVNPENIPVVIGRHGITISINNKGLFADIVHGPFHSIYYSFKTHKYNEL